MPRTEPSIAKLKSLTDELGDSFAKAFAKFLKETAAPDDTEEAREELEAKLQSSEGLNVAGKKYAEQLHREYEALKKEGKAPPLLRLEDLPKPKPTLLNLVRQSGITQKELAKKTGMDAAMVSRVLKDPDRSKLATVKRIAHALGVRLGDLNLDAA